MKKIFSFLLIILLVALFVSCGDGGSSNNQKKSAEISSEMKDFMTYCSKGNFEKVKEGLQKYAAENLDTKGMEDYDLEKPEVVETKEQGEQTTYILHVKSGATKRAYTIGWKNGKIVSISDDGFVFD